MLGQNLIKAYLVPWRELQHNIFAHSRRSPIWTRLVSLLLAKLGPILSLSDSMLHDRLLNCSSYSFRDLLVTHRNSRSRYDYSELTLTFFPSSLTLYSTTVMIPFSSTVSSGFGSRGCSKRNLRSARPSTYVIKTYPIRQHRLPRTSFVL